MIGTAPPATHQELHDEMPDPLLGNYSPLYTKFTERNQSAEDLLMYALLTNDEPPMIYLALAEFCGEPIIKVLHRLNPFKVGPKPTPYDGHCYAFSGDVVGGSHIDMVRLPARAFERIKLEVHSADEIDAEVLTWTEGDGNDYMVSLDDDDDSETVEVTRLIPVPHSLLHLVFGRTHTPATLWLEMGGVIKTEGITDQVEPLIAWMQAAIQASEGDGIPEISFGNEDRSPPLAGGKRLHEMRQRILHADFPHLKPGTAMTGTEDKLAAALESIEASRSQQHLEMLEERKAARAPKTVAEKFPYSLKYYLRIAGVSDQVDLPPLYPELAKAHKGDKRLVVQRLLAARVEDPDAMGPGVPIVTKALLDTIVSGELGTESAIDDLTQGLHPFTCGHIQGSDGEKVQALASAYDGVMDGELHPTVTEHVMLTTTEVRFPERDWTAREMIRATSVVLDVVQGVRHPHAIAFRKFANSGYDRIINALNNMTETDRNRYGNVHPRILREAQCTMILYFTELLLGKDPDLPNYDEVVRLVRRRRFDHLQELPSRYTEKKSGKKSGDEDPPGGAKKGDLGARVNNEEPTDRSWQTLYANSGKKLASMAPRSPKDDNNEQCCLSYHLKGFCYENCPRSSTHGLLVGFLKRKMVTFVKRELTPKEQTEPTPKGESADDGKS